MLPLFRRPARRSKMVWSKRATPIAVARVEPTAAGPTVEPTVEPTAEPTV